MGVAARTARLGAGLRQADVADRAGLTQSFLSRIERGHGTAASLETWAAVAAALGTQLAAFLERAPGTTLPRDYEHLKRQQLVISVASLGAWAATVEHAIDLTWERPRSIDVLLTRANEIAVVEVWDLLDDVGRAFRGLDAKVARVGREHAAERVSGLMLVRRTTTNRRLVREFAALFRSHLPASSARWLSALSTDTPMPDEPGLAWTDVLGARLVVARL